MLARKELPRTPNSPPPVPLIDRIHQQQFEWSLAKERRAHVHGTITSYELPVTHVTRRVGSPFTLVLTKTRALFTRDAAERATWARDLAWLREIAKTFTSPGRVTPRRTARR